MPVPNQERPFAADINTEQLDRLIPGSIGFFLGNEIVQLQANLELMRSNDPKFESPEAMRLERLRRFYSGVGRQLNIQHDLDSSNPTVRAAIVATAWAVNNLEVSNTADALTSVGMLVVRYRGVRDTVARYPRICPAGWTNTEQEKPAAETKPVRPPRPWEDVAAQPQPPERKRYPVGSVGAELQAAADAIPGRIATADARQLPGLQRVQTFYRGLLALLEAQNMLVFQAPEVVNAVLEVAQSVEIEGMSVMAGLMKVPELILANIGIENVIETHPLLRDAGFKRDTGEVPSGTKK